MFENVSQENENATAVKDIPEPQPAATGDANSYMADMDLAESPHADVLKKVKNFRIEFGPSRKDILNFTNQLSVMVRAGISLQDSLESIATQSDNKKFSAIIFDLKNKIEEGRSFSQALNEHGDIFSNLYINMVAAAEISGSLSSMLRKLAEYLDPQQYA